MKTIGQVVFDRYKSDQSLPERHRIGIDCYIDWAQLGARETQRWISISEELPEDADNIVKSGLYDYSEHAVIVQTCNGKYSITKRTRFNNGNWHWSGSASFDKSVISWRPIQRT